MARGNRLGAAPRQPRRVAYVANPGMGKCLVLEIVTPQRRRYGGDQLDLRSQLVGCSGELAVRTRLRVFAAWRPAACFPADPPRLASRHLRCGLISTDAGHTTRTDPPGAGQRPPPTRPLGREPRGWGIVGLCRRMPTDPTGTRRVDTRSRRPPRRSLAPAATREAVADEWSRAVDRQSTESRGPGR